MQFDTTSNYLLAQGHANNCNFINPYPEFADSGDVARQRLTKIAEEVMANASAFKSQPYSESQHDAAIATQALSELARIKGANHTALHRVAQDLRGVSSTGLSRPFTKCDSQSYSDELVEIVRRMSRPR